MKKFMIALFLLSSMAQADYIEGEGNPFVQRLDDAHFRSLTNSVHMKCSNYYLDRYFEDESLPKLCDKRFKQVEKYMKEKFDIEVEPMMMYTRGFVDRVDIVDDKYLKCGKEFLWDACRKKFPENFIF